VKESGSNQRIPKKPKFGKKATVNNPNEKKDTKVININCSSSEYSGDDSEDSEWNENDDKIGSTNKINR
jgi:hypothetical protein